MYSVTVRIDGFESRRRSAGLLHIVIGFFMVAKAADHYRLTDYHDLFSIIPTLLVAGVSLFYGFFRRRVDPFAHYNIGMRLIQTFAFVSLFFMFLKHGREIDYVSVGVFILLCLLLLLSERKIFRETTIFFDEHGISIPGYFRDHLVEWDQVAEVVLREDFLTIFHVRQKYLQFQVMQDLSTLEIAKLNAFCREKIENVNRES